MLKQLLNFWLFPIFGMFFAAGTAISAGAGAEGGGDGGGVDSSAADGGEGNDATDLDEGGDLDAGADGEGGSDAAGEDGGTENQDPDAPVDLGDGRQVPAKWKKLFDAAQKLGVAKEAKQLYYAQQRLAKAIPGGINGAIQMAKDIEELGGIESIQQLQDDLGTYQQDAEAFENNPSKWVETGFQENADSALKAFVYSLDYVGEHHPEHYDHLMAKVIVNDLAQLDVRAIHAKLAAMKDDPDAKVLARALAEYYNSRLETSKQAPEKKTDAKSKALTDRESQVERREMDVRFKEVNRDAFPALRTGVTGALKAEAKRAGVDLDKLSKDYPGEWRDLLNDIHKRVMRSATKDSRFLDKYYAHVKTGDLKRALKAINDKHNALIPDAVREAIAERGLFRKKKGAAGGDKGAVGADKSAAAQNQGWTRVSQRPANSAIDWEKTSTALQLDGKYILKDGKKVIVQY